MSGYNRTDIDDFYNKLKENNRGFGRDRVSGRLIDVTKNNFLLQDPVATTEREGYNTKIVVKGTPLYGISGSKTFYYKRLVLSEYANDVANVGSVNKPVTDYKPENSRLNSNRKRLIEYLSNKLKIHHTYITVVEKVEPVATISKVTFHVDVSSPIGNCTKFGSATDNLMVVADADISLYFNAIGELDKIIPKDIFNISPLLRLISPNGRDEVRFELPIGLGNYAEVYAVNPYTGEVVLDSAKLNNNLYIAKEDDREVGYTVIDNKIIRSRRTFTDVLTNEDIDITFTNPEGGVDIAASFHPHCEYSYTNIVETTVTQYSDVNRSYFRPHPVKLAYPFEKLSEV